MGKSLIVCLVLLGMSALATDANFRGVSKSAKGQYLQALKSKRFRCFDGTKTIPETQFNDDYCDCSDGSDEPGTSACSNSKFWCQNKFHEGRFLPSSRVNDGVCDCCDGTDEYDSARICSNVCFELGAEKRKELQDKAIIYKNGLDIRTSYISRSKTSLDLKESELQSALNDLSGLQDPISKLKSEIEELEKLLEPPQAVPPVVDSHESQAIDNSESGDPTSGNEAHVNVESMGDETSFEKLNPQINVVDTQATQSEDEPLYKDSNEEVEEETKTEQRQISFDDIPEEDSAPYDDDDYYRDEMEAEYEDDFRDFGEDNPDIEEPKKSETEPQTSDGKSIFSRLMDKLREIFEIFTNRLNGLIGNPVVPASSSELSPLEQKRLELQELESRRSDLESKRDRIQKIVNKDYGPGKGFYELHERCFDLVTNEYTYSICPYKQVTQQGDSTANLGRSFSFEDNYSKMVFRQGDGCWQGPQRSMTVTLICGAKEEVQRVEEPERCVYTSTMTTPMACSPEELRKLEDELQKVLNPGDE